MTVVEVGERVRENRENRRQETGRSRRICYRRETVIIIIIITVENDGCWRWVTCFFLAWTQWGAPTLIVEIHRWSHALAVLGDGITSTEYFLSCVQHLNTVCTRYTVCM